MGIINSTSKYDISRTRLPQSPCGLSTSLCARSAKLSNDRTAKCSGFRKFFTEQRFCMKRKVLLLGLDGVGKTEIFKRLVANREQSSKCNSLPRPTLGYNVETIDLYSRHFLRRRRHKITLWDCGGQSSLRSLWPYHFAGTSLLTWVINVYDRSRLEANIDLLSQILKNPLLNGVPILIVVCQTFMRSNNKNNASDENRDETLLTNLEVAFRFLTTISTSRTSIFKWQVLEVNLNDTSKEDIRKVRQSFIELMDL